MHLQAMSPEPYRTILWIGDSVWKKPEQFPLFLTRLKELGINTGIVMGDADPKPFVDAGMPYYVENVVNRGLCLKFRSSVTDWDKFVTQWTKNGRPEAAFVRDVSLDDPLWRREARGAMQAAVRVHKPHQPLFYDIRDELSVTISANPFDYDFSPTTLTAFRAWLKTQYVGLSALNQQWETSFASWDAVVPFSTDRIKNRMAGGGAEPKGQPDWTALSRTEFATATAKAEKTRWNFAPWCDFRTYMDVALARALSDIRDAARSADPNARVIVEGTQMPSAFGGYDLARLSAALDGVEPYDIAGAREIFGSFLPGKPLFLTTVGETDARAAQRRLWHLLLLGDSGCIVWWSEDCLDFTKDGWPLTPRAQALAPVLKELQGPVASLFRRATREVDPIFLHYSQPSIQLAWLLESTVDGSTWHRRFSSFEAANNRHAQVRMAWLAALQDLGYTPQFTAAPELLPPSAALVLPHSLALNPRERRAIDVLKTVVSSGQVGVFDAHGTLFDGALPKTRACPLDPLTYAASRLKPTSDTGFPDWLAAQLPTPPPIRVRAADRVRVHRYRLNSTRLLAFERGIAYQMSESLQQAGGNQALEVPIDVVAPLDTPGYAVDLTRKTRLGKTDTLRFRLDPWRPALFAIVAKPGDDKALLDELG